jgi:PAS domain S-box-containing protein
LTPEEFLQLGDALPEAVLLVSGDGCILAGNRAAGKRLSCPSRELVGRRLDALVATPAGKVHEYLVACSRSPAPVPGLLEFRLPGCKVLPCRCEGWLIRPRSDTEPAELLLRFVPKREAPSQFTVLNQRIDELSGEIGRRTRLERQLLEHQERLRVTLTSIGEAVIATDCTGNIVLMNPVAESLTAWSLAEAAGQPLDAVFRIVNEETRQTAESPVARVLREGQIVGLANHTILVARDGTEWAIDDSGAPIRSDSGEMLGVVLVFREVTERRRMEADLRRQAADLVEADRRKNEFLAMLAHELRNPLAPIINSVHVLRGRGPHDPVVHRYGDVIERQARHLSRLVDDLLEVSRISRGLVTLRRETVDLRQAVEHALETSRPQMEGRGHRCDVQLPQEPLYVEGDAHRLAQVTANLLNNAAKYTPPGGLIRVVARREGHTAVLRVQDTGAGIGPELLPHVFDLFTQGDRSLARTEGGLGIGLSMVKMLVELHGGTVEARSEGPGQGSEFIVRVPAVEAHAAPSAQQPPPAGAGRLRVLIVEDNVDAAQTLAELLGTWGHEVRSVHTGGLATAAALEFRPEVVILDIGLPGMDGYEVAQRLREAGCVGPECSLVALTGYGSAEDRRRTREAGFDHHLTKPADPGEIDKLLRNLLARPLCPGAEPENVL